MAVLSKVIITLLHILLCLPLIAAMPAAPSPTPKQGEKTDDSFPPPVAEGGTLPTMPKGSGGASPEPLQPGYGGAITIDLSQGLPALLKNSGDDQDDLKQFEQQQQDAAAAAARGEGDESVSGGFWQDLRAQTAQSKMVDSKVADSDTGSTNNTGIKYKREDTGSTDKASKSDTRARDITTEDTIASSNRNGMSIVPRDVPSKFVDCLFDYKLLAYRKTAKDYPKYATAYNQRIPNQADVVVLAMSTSDVQFAVICAAKYKVPVQAKAGGHSYASFSSAGGTNGGLVIDLRRMTKLQYDSKSKQAIADGGIRLGNLALGLTSLGQAMPHGDCPSVGLAGHSLHGGFGYTSRMWGLSTDAIIGMDVVTSDGRLYYASPSKNKDLFWAMRGAGDSFGIATRFYLQTYSRPKRVIRFVYNMDSATKIYGSSSKMTKAFIDAQACVTSKRGGIDERWGLTVRLSTNRYQIAGYFYGDLATFTAAEAKCLKNMPVKATVSQLSFNEALGSIASGVSLSQPEIVTATSHFFAKSILIPPKAALTTEKIQAYFRELLKGDITRLQNKWVVTFRLMGGVGSQVPARTDSAVSDRDSLWIVQHDGTTRDDPRDMTRFINTITDKMTSVTDGGKFGAFAPFVDPSLSNTQAHQKYFSSSTYSKLRDLKTIYDPNEVFQNPQSVYPRKK